MRWDFWLRGSRWERRMDKELRFHLEQQIRDNISAGLDAKEARAKAYRDFGAIELVKEECRDQRPIRWLDDLICDSRFAARIFVRSPGFAFTVVLMLALGVGANTAAFSVVNAALLRPLPLPSGERVTSIQVKSALSGETEPHASPTQFLAWLSGNKSFDLLAAAAGSRVQISGSREPEEVRLLQVSPSFQELAGIHPRLGHAFQEGDFRSGSRRVCLISSRLWQRRFSEDPSVVGRTLYVDSEPVDIIGVLPRDLAFPDAETDIWVLLRFTPDHQTQRYLDVYGRLRLGVSVQDAQAWLDQATARAESELPDWLRSKGVTVVPIRDQVIADERTLLLVLSGIALCVLLICCANIGSLLMARHLNREREIALRASIGATRDRLFRQLLTEALGLCLAGAVMGFAVGRTLLSISYDFLSNSRFKALITTGDRILDVRVAAFTLVLALLTTILFGLVPSLHFAQAGLNEALKSSPRSQRRGRAGSSMNRYLIAVELAVSFILLTGAGLLVRSFVGLVSADRGYTVSYLLTARLPTSTSGPVTAIGRKQLFRRLIDELEATPNVIAVGVVTGLPLGGLNATMTLERPGQPLDPENLPWAGINCVNDAYFWAMGIRFVKGRAFDSGDKETGMRVAIVNETLARQFWPGREPVGQELMPGVRVVGVVQDIRQEALDARQGPAFYLPFEQRNGLAAAPNFLVIRTKGDPRALIPALKQAVRSADPLQPVLDIRTMEDVLSRSVTQRRLLASLLAGFAALAVLLSVVGVYGVLSYLVSHRSKEIGIRICLGAQHGEILILLAKQLSLPVGGGLLAGFAVSLIVTRVLSQWLFAVQPNDPATVVTAAVMTAAVALLGGLAPASRAMRVDPLTAIRME
jgi:putative ABC transport system permease protein